MGLQPNVTAREGAYPIASMISAPSYIRVTVAWAACYA